MDNAKLLIAAMAERCRSLLQDSKAGLEEPLPPPTPTYLNVQHLLKMCDQIDENAEQWSNVKLHRWIGFIQAGLLANRIMDMQGLRDMFREAKNAYGSSEADLDLVDHLDPLNSFSMELGGEA